MYCTFTSATNAADIRRKFHGSSRGPWTGKILHEHIVVVGVQQRREQSLLTSDNALMLHTFILTQYLDTLPFQGPLQRHGPCLLTVLREWMRSV